MKNLILALTLALASDAFAATSKLECHFTEPFFSLEFDLASGKVTRTEPNWEDDASTTVTKTVAENAKVESDLSDPFLPKYTVKTQAGEVIAAIQLNMKGSDGMSNIIYPFDIQHAEMWGGCESDLIKRYDPYENEQ